MNQRIFDCSSDSNFAYRRDDIEMKLQRDIADYRKQLDLHTALSETLRHALSLEQAQRKRGETKIDRMTQVIAKLRARSCDEIYYERAHSTRLKLWVHTMLATLLKTSKGIMHREVLLHRQKMINMKVQRTLRSDLWRQKTAVHALGMDTSALFLFFTHNLF